MSKSRKLKIAAKKNPWLNFLKEFRENNKGNGSYTGSEGVKKILIDARVIFKEFSAEEKDKYRNVQGNKNVQTAANVNQMPRGKKR